MKTGTGVPTVFIGARRLSTTMAGVTIVDVSVRFNAPVAAVIDFEIEVIGDDTDAALRNLALEMLPTHLDELKAHALPFWIDSDRDHMERVWRGETFAEG